MLDRIVTDAMWEFRVWKAADGMLWLRRGNEWFEFDEYYQCTDYQTTWEPEQRIAWARNIVRTVCS